MDYHKCLPRVQIVKTIEPARELISHLSRLSGFIFDHDKIYRDERMRRCLNDAIFYALNDYLFKNKIYPINFSPRTEFVSCCLFIVRLNGFDNTQLLAEDDALDELLEEIQDYFIYLDIGDKYDIWEVKIENRTLFKINYKGDYRIELYEFLNFNLNEMEETMVVLIDDNHTLLKEYDRRNRTILEERNRHRRGESLSF